MSSRWQRSGAARGDEYDARWGAMEQAGFDPHGEAAFVVGYRPATVLDAGCGTGRVAIELARRGVDVAGVDLDGAMLEAARRKAPCLEWHLADLAELDLEDERGRRRAFDAIVAAGNVMIFLQRGTEGTVLQQLSAHLEQGGRLVAGFETHRLDVDHYDDLCRRAGLMLDERFSTWDRDPYSDAGYAVSVHRRA